MRIVKGAAPLYVQYGCGLCAPHEWLNFDASPRLRLERIRGVKTVLRHSIGALFAPNVRYGDIVAGLPVPDHAAAGVYCSHVLEHLPRGDIAAALSETRRMLMPGGRFRLVVPDLQWRALHYVEAAENGDPAAADRFIDACMLGTREKRRRLVARLRQLYGLGAHLWMYDLASLAALLTAAGFAGIRRCRAGDSGDPMFDLVEQQDRFFAGDCPELAIEAISPGAKVACGRSATAAARS